MSKPYSRVFNKIASLQAEYEKLIDTIKKQSEKNKQLIIEIEAWQTRFAAQQRIIEQLENNLHIST